MKVNPYKIIFKNAAVLTAARLFSRIFQFFLFIYAARSLGVTSFGIFSFAYALVKILGISMDMGISRYCIQQLSRNVRMMPTYVGAGLIAKIFLITAGYVLIIGTGWIMGKDLLTMKVLFILATMEAFDSIGSSFESVFSAHEKMQYSAVIISVSNGIMSALGIVLLYYYNSLLLFCGTLAFGAFLRLVLGAFWCLKKYGTPLFNFDFLFIKHLIKKSIPFSLAFIFVTIYYNVDSAILDIFDGSEIVGYYNAAYRLIEAPLFISASVAAALFPTISRLYHENPVEIKKMVSGAFNKGLALGLSAAVVISFLSEDLISVIYGPGYAPAARVLPILIFSVAFIMPGTICGTTVRATDRQSTSAFIVGGGVILNIILNLILIPRYSFLGAAWATLITEIVVVNVYIQVIRRYIGSIFQMKFLFRILILNSLLLSFLYLTTAAGFWFQLIGCTILFFPFTLITGVVTMKEVREIISWT